MSSGGELAFQADVDKVAKQLGWKRFAQANAPRGSTKGFPDRLYLRRGRLLVLEFKAEKDGRVSPEQAEWMRAWYDVADNLAVAWKSTKPVPVRVALVRPSDYDEIVRWLA